MHRRKFVCWGSCSVNLCKLTGNIWYERCLLQVSHWPPLRHFFISWLTKNIFFVPSVKNSHFLYQEWDHHLSVLFAQFLILLSSLKTGSNYVAGTSFNATNLDQMCLFTFYMYFCYSILRVNILHFFNLIWSKFLFTFTICICTLW